MIPNNIQSKVNKIEYNACIDEAISIRMGRKISQLKTQNKEIKLKTRWILINYPAHYADAAKHL
jgi:hypothetical protein